MPRIDRTFNDTDVIRIVNKHLTSSEKERVILVLCEITDLEVVIKMLKILLETTEQINDLIRPVKKWLKRIPILRNIILILDFTEIILESLIYLIEFFESISNNH